jgi:aminomethyltransferase
MVPFGGWEMPLEYSGILAEHQATRTAAGLFDLSHMGEFEFSGPGACQLVAALITNDPTRLGPGQGQYAPMCTERGTIVDDVIVYHLPDRPGTYLMVVNAANSAKDWSWIQQVAADRDLDGSVALVDRSMQTALIAIQGPRAVEILTGGVESDTPLAPADVRSFALAPFQLRGTAVLAARTGYTGEDGFELFCAAEDAQAVWRLLLDQGRDKGLMPAGLGARDTLRLEARLPLYGSDITEETTPLEAGLGRWVKLDKPSFIGKDALATQRERGLTRQLVGLAMLDRSIPRAHYRVVALGGESLGMITSGSYGPTVRRGIALAYLPVAFSAIGTQVQVAIRDQLHPAEVVKTPFYRRAK